MYVCMGATIDQKKNNRKFILKLGVFGVDFFLKETCWGICWKNDTESRYIFSEHT